MRDRDLRKRRTREHVIADLSVNHIERFVLRAGFTAQIYHRDYGLDLSISTFDAEGQVEPGLIFIQAKATDHISRLRHGKSISVPIDERDLQAWLQVDDPVILVIYDAQREVAYWGNVRDHFSAANSESGLSLRKFRTMRISASSRFDDAGVRKIAEGKRTMYGGFARRHHGK